MPVINHILIFVSYALAIGAAAVSLPQYLPVQQFELHPAIWQGGAGIMAAAILHLALSRFGRDRRVNREILLLKSNNIETRSELTRAREEAKRIYEAIEGVAMSRQAASRPAELDQVITEVKMLQGLVEQLYERQGKDAQAQGQAHAMNEKVAAAGGSRASAPQAQPQPEPTAQPAPPPRRVLTGLNDAQMLDIVRDGLRNNRVDLFIQPIVSLPQRKHRHYECFSRIRLDENSMVVPEQYLAIAEREGLIAAIDNMLLFRCVQLVRRVQKRKTQSGQQHGIFINISEHTLGDTKFFKDFVSFVAAHRDLAPNLVFEFAQAHVSRHGQAVMFELERLARLGFRFSMDQVTDLNFDVDDLAARHFRYIKIDATRMLEQMNNSERQLDGRVLKQALERSGIDLIVEKIETEQKLIEILDVPVDYGQGYLFGEPRQMRDTL
jgi:cyclic-di-GMP phosphodiesterase, flagellum assembly factor TipF